MALSDHEIKIDKIDIRFVQTLIFAVDESHLPTEEKVKVRKTLDRWLNALTLTDKIRVTF